MKAYTGYVDWIRNSNSAARFREAFALADQMDPPLKMACVEKLYRIANAEWEEIKEMSQPTAAALSRGRGRVSDISKSVVLRSFLWLVAVAATFVVVSVIDVLVDELPIWLTAGRHHSVEGVVFWYIVGPGIWNWLSRRVWIGSADSANIGERT